jgi:hypothetical protein
MLKTPRLVLLSADAAERRRVQQVLSEHAILTPAGSLAEAGSLLASGRYDALFCADSFQPSKKALDEVRERTPGVPVIFFPASSSRAWSEGFGVGAMDWLAAAGEAFPAALVSQCSITAEIRCVLGNTA